MQERGPDVTLICATLGHISKPAHGHTEAVTVPAASEPGISSFHRNKPGCLRESRFMLPLWNPLNSHTDPGVQLVKVFKNSIGNGGIPHPVRANSERKEILKSVICFTFFGCV